MVRCHTDRKDVFGLLRMEDLKIKKKSVEFDVPVALVLSGGGGKGAYEIGAWKALMDYGVKIGGVYGTSVGALNAVGIAMGDFKTARDVWLNMREELVANRTADFRRLVETAKGKTKIIERFKTIREIFSDSGIDVTPLRRELEARVSEERVRNSGIDLGIVTYSLSEMKPKLMFIDDIPSGKLVDYVMASANYPLFQREEIDSKKFVDGGVYRNIPLDMAKKKGFKNIVVVEIGSKRLADSISLLTSMFSKDFKILRIKPRKMFGGPMDFDREVSRKFLLEGYLDTLSYLKLTRGDYTYILESEDCIGKLFFDLDSKSRREAMEILGMGKTETEGSHYFYYRQLLPVLEDCLETTLPEETSAILIDRHAGYFGIEQFRLYSFKELLEGLIDEYDSDPEILDGKQFNDIPAKKIMEFLKYLHEKRGNVLDIDEEFRLLQKNIQSLMDTEA